MMGLNRREPGDSLVSLRVLASAGRQRATTASRIDWGSIEICMGAKGKRLPESDGVRGATRVNVPVLAS